MKIPWYIAIRNPKLNRHELGKYGIWIMKDGERIHVSQMKNSHLVNTLNHLWKRAKRENTPDYSLPEPKGEMAQYLLEQEMMYDTYYTSPLDIFSSWEITQHLSKELIKRNLQFPTELQDYKELYE